jgi:hypothetical protein
LECAISRVIGAVNRVTEINATAKTGANRHLLAIGQMAVGRFAYLMVTERGCAACGGGSSGCGGRHSLFIRHGFISGGGCSRGAGYRGGFAGYAGSRIAAMQTSARAYANGILWTVADMAACTRCSAVGAGNLGRCCSAGIAFIGHLFLFGHCFFFLCCRGWRCSCGHRSFSAICATARGPAGFDTIAESRADGTSAAIF